LLFYVFSSPFTSNRELRHRWSGYVYVSTVIYLWLSVAAAFHLPILHYDTKIPISLFSPLFLASSITLLLCEGIVKLLNKWFVFHVGFRQNSLEVFQNSVLVSIICCIVYTQCGTSSSSILAREYESQNSDESDAIDITVNAVCAILFSGHTNGHSRDLPTVLVLWSTAMSMLIINFIFERLSGFRGLFADPKREKRERAKQINLTTRKSVKKLQVEEIQQVKADDSQPPMLTKLFGENLIIPDSTDTANPEVVEQISSRPSSPSLPRYLPDSYIDSLPLRIQHSLLQPTMHDMVSWYEMAATATAVDFLIHLKLFLGRFDMRTLQAAMPQTPQTNKTNLKNFSSLKLSASPKSRRFAANPDHQHQTDSLPFVYDHLSNDEDLWFDWMSDCGDGFNPSYQVARMLAAPTLKVTVKRKFSKLPGLMELPRAKVLFLGGDLAYPTPNADTYENRFFNTFQCAMPPPANYRPEQISVAKPACAGGLSGLSSYSGPQVFAIPGNHDWFDGLQTYLRYICGRDFCGGWLMPQEKSYFAVKLNHGWWCLALDNALANDIDVNQFQYFARLSTMMGDNDRVILMYHEPDWVIRAHEKIEIGQNIQQLQELLNGKVVLKIAGDLHHYTRHMPTTKTPNQTNGKTVSAKSPNVSAQPSEVDIWRWYNPFSWFKSFLTGRRSYNSRVYMEDLLQDMTNESNSTITLARTVSSPTLGENENNQNTGSSSGNHHFKASINTLQYSNFAAPLTAPHSRTISPFTSNNISVTPTKEIRSSGFSLVDSPPPSPLDQSYHASPTASELSRRIHIVKNSAQNEEKIYREENSPQTEIPPPPINFNEDSNNTENFNQIQNFPMSDWNVSDVSCWLSLIGCSDLIAIFDSHDIDGKLLVNLDDDDLAAELNITSRLRRKKLFAERKQWIEKENIAKSTTPTETSPQQAKNGRLQNSNSNNGHGRSFDDNNSHDNKNGNFISSSSTADYARIAFSPPAPSRREPPICIVSGGGGAFLHGTHVPSAAPIDVNGETYVRTTSYPSLSTSRSYALLNIFGFRKRNFRFDLFGGCVYFLLVFSVLPLCHLDPIISGNSWFDCFYRFIRAIFLIHIKMAEESWLSFAVFLIAWFGCIQLAEESWPMYKRIIIGTIHCLCHSITAFGALVLLETLIELGISRGLLGQQESVLLTLTKTFQLSAPIIKKLDSLSFDAASSAIKLLSAIFDVPEAIATLKIKMCAAYPSHTAALFLDPNHNNYKEPDVASIYAARIGMSRYEVLAYYFSFGLYLWVLATSLVSFVFGSYLYLMSAFFNAHATPAFSSLRVEGYKNFIRFHLTNNGDLELFVLGMDRCPRKWELDPLWSGFTESAGNPSHEWKVPSVFKPAKGEPDGVRIVDYLLIKKESNNSQS